MIDKLELRLPRLTQFTADAREFILESRHFERSTRATPAGRYEWVTDLRPTGIDALLHYGLKRKDNDPHQGEHKLELLDTGEKRYSELLAQIESAIEWELNDLEIMRIDLCADIPEVPVEWFLNRVYVRFKRYAHEIGRVNWQHIGKAGIQTICAGRRPNLIRIYDKVAEYREQLRKIRRKQSRDADELTLLSEFGVSEKAVITRVERQIGGHRIPASIGRFGQLARLPDFNPFTNLVFASSSGAMVPTIRECGLDMWLTGTRLQELQGQMGLQQFRRFLNSESSGNGARYLKRYEDFLRPEGANILNSASLLETYRASVTKQLAA